MANPRQRRKARSSSHKAVSHSKRAKRLQKKMPSIRGPKALQDAWDPSKTVRQNYLALGLEHDLNPNSSGGSEVNITRAIDTNTRRPQQTTSSDDLRSSVLQGLPRGFGRIIRDSSGDVVRVELPSDEDASHTPKQEQVIDPLVVTKESDLRKWAHDRPERSRGGSSGSMEDSVVQGEGWICSGYSTGIFDGVKVLPRDRQHEVVSCFFSHGKIFQSLTYGPVDLENLAASANIHERHTSSGERMYLERLVSKYGDDLHQMARDRRLNPGQRTANELKRAVARAGGFGALCKSTVTEVTE
ncbi:ribosome biogenesis protein Nop16 [Boletus edulis]|uniref:Nucleolar protein 16 n=1 Tax=Boletus edulis BED1 TaxID=1328754 RepID=A0AAD4BQU5_BOLED|nr:ribosome biogenesis protein Nop16 [Boletus edulis]KAF8436939.1 ribosome biogenesis protein Nop16 [Boletus edulis BED1]